jgi:hypothetical protein
MKSTMVRDFEGTVFRVFCRHPTVMGRPIVQVDPVPFETLWEAVMPWMRNHYRKMVHAALSDVGLPVPPLAEVLEFGEA